uniref:G-protein coupled receptors family 1 profile domain-containing protein n=1 Tax=Erpetoichthys calabaricus TaxID=27687 RepID=A0A8C4RK39_ERPCA
NKHLITKRYCYHSENVSCVKEPRTPLTVVTLYFCASVAGMLTFYGNLVVIISISHFKQLHTPTNVLVLSLALADCMIGIISIETCWYFGEVFCFIYTICLAFLLTVSVINLSVIAIDRYIAICHPLTYSNKITVRTGALAVSAIWISTFTYICDCVLVFNSTCATIDLIYSFILPVSVMITLYAKIFLIAKRHARAISTQKAAKTLGIVVTVFFLCWLPFYVCSLLNQFMNFAVSSGVAWACLWIGNINSGLNPIIYALSKLPTTAVIELKLQIFRYG